jgi:mannose-6-phosphate isomerase-like protein (cupin superfamily)
MSRARPARATRIDKPWGHELLWAQTERYVGKILHVRAGEALSLQYHRVKDETLYVLSGTAELELGDREDALETVVVEPGDVVHLWPGRRHRITARTACELLEVSTPEIDDVVRLADRYGRAGG